jgi:hypothetical protein
MPNLIINNYFSNFFIGELIVQETPYSSILLPEYYGTHCQSCFHRILAPIPCWCCARVSMATMSARATADNVNKSARATADNVNKSARATVKNVNKSARATAVNVNKNARATAKNVNKSARATADNVNKSARATADNVNKSARATADNVNKSACATAFNAHGLQQQCNSTEHCLFSVLVPTKLVPTQSSFRGPVVDSRSTE